MTSMTSTIKRSARLTLVAIAAVSAIATSASAADASTRTPASTRPNSITFAPPANPGTNGKETCVGSQLACGPGSKFHAACDALHGGYEGSNPGPLGIPQTWSCNVP